MRVTIHYTTNQKDVFSSSETVEEIDELIRELSFIEEVVDVIESPLQKKQNM
jgi:predicted RND superfamily exporter protein